MDRRKRKEGKLGVTLSRGNTPNSRYIQAEPAINLVPRRRVGGRSTSKEPREERARELEEGRAVENEIEIDRQIERERKGGKEGGRERAGQLQPGPESLRGNRLLSTAYTPHHLPILLAFATLPLSPFPPPPPLHTHLPVDRGWPMKLIIIKSHSVCRGRPPFVRPRVLLTLIRLHPGFITSY